MNKTIKRIISLLLAGLMLAFTACVRPEDPQPDPTAAPEPTAKPVQTEARIRTLSANVTPAYMQGKKVDDAFSKAQLDFAVELFKNGFDKEQNSLISPLSVLLALAMTANGAYGETLSQMEQMFGMPINDLNAYLYSYLHSLVSNAGSKVSIANSIWYRAFEEEFNFVGDLKPLFTPDQRFLEKNAAIYGADIFSAVFDGATLDALNDWVKEHTDGMIEKILDQIDPEAVMYLVNTLLFDAEWSEKYNQYQVIEGEFTALSGEKQTVSMMHSSEGTWIGDETCSGFLKFYKSGPYAFAALLPNEGTDIDSFVESLTGEKVLSMLENPWEGEVLAAMPKFSFDYSVELPEALQNMGMTDAFSVERADFSNLGETAEGYNLYIGNVLHKAYIEVTEAGTRAGAATVVELNCGAAEPSETRQVVLDRPFVFMILDTNTNLPLFIGTLTSVN